MLFAKPRRQFFSRRGPLLYYLLIFLSVGKIPDFSDLFGEVSDDDEDNDIDDDGKDITDNDDITDSDDSTNSDSDDEEEDMDETSSDSDSSDSETGRSTSFCLISLHTQTHACVRRTELPPPPPPPL